MAKAAEEVKALPNYAQDCEVELCMYISHSLQLSEMEIRDRPHPPINCYPHTHEYH